MTGPIEAEFPRIAEYAYLSDSHTGALVAPDGSVEWLCVPRFDSPSVFAALLDRDAGRFRLGPAELRVPIARRYDPGTNVLETTWTTGDGWLVVRDALSIREWREDGGHEHARPPSTHDADGVLVRTAECIEGEVEVEMVCEIAHEYGSRPATWELDGERAAVTGDEPPLRLAADMPLAADGAAITARRRLGKGEGCFCVLGWSGADELPATLPEAQSRVATTLQYWRDWLAAGSFPGRALR